MNSLLRIIRIVAGAVLLCGCSEKSSPTGSPADKHVETPLGIEVASMPLTGPQADFKRLMDTLNSNKIPFQMVGDPSGYHAFVPRDQFDAAHDILKREQQNGLHVTLK